MWFAYSLMAAIFWGATYTLYSVLLKSLPPAAVMCLVSIGTTTVYFILASMRGELSSGVLTLSEKPHLIALGIMAVAFIASAMLLLLHSMKASNATLAALVEITYPLFLALFSWAFLKETQMNWGTFAGALLILSGVSCVFYFNRSVGS